MKSEKKMFQLTKDSTPLEVATYFINIFQKEEEELVTLIKENISGDILPLLNEEDYEELEINIELKEKIQKVVKDNINKLTRNENDIDISININSSENEIKQFFNNNLKFKKEIKNLNGKQLFSLNEQNMKELGLNIGQRRKLNMIIGQKEDNYKNEPKKKAKRKKKYRQLQLVDIK